MEEELTIEQIIRQQDFEEMKTEVWDDDKRGCAYAVANLIDVVYFEDRVEIVTVNRQHTEWRHRVVRGKWQRMSYQRLVEKMKAAETEVRE